MLKLVGRPMHLQHSNKKKQIGKNNSLALSSYAREFIATYPIIDVVHINCTRLLAVCLTSVMRDRDR